MTRDNLQEEMGALLERIPTAQEWCDFYRQTDKNADKSLDELRARWNEMAPRYAHKQTRSGYLAQLTDLLALAPGESVLDMGCGPGVLSVPLAQQGHDIVAVDFSDGMLTKLHEAIAAAGVESRFKIYRRAWQESWDGIPQADVAVSSRSLTTHDIADAVAKLESKAKSRVVVTTACGEVPWIDARVERALGREVTPVRLASDFTVLLNYLLASGRLPEVRYIEVPRVPQSDDPAELKAFLAKAAEATPDEMPLLESFFAEHVVDRPGGGVMMDYTQQTRWALLCWRPLASR